MSCSFSSDGINLVKVHDAERLFEIIESGLPWLCVLVEGTRVKDFAFLAVASNIGA